MKVLRILVVEDDALIATLLADMFAGMGHDVCESRRPRLVQLPLPFNADRT